MCSNVRPNKRCGSYLLDIITKYATGVEAILAKFNGKGMADTHLSGGDCGDEAATANHCYDKGMKDKKRHGEEMVEMTDHATKHQPK